MEPIKLTNELRRQAAIEQGLTPVTSTCIECGEEKERYILMPMGEFTHTCEPCIEERLRRLKLWKESEERKMKHYKHYKAHQKRIERAKRKHIVDGIKRNYLLGGSFFSNLRLGNVINTVLTTDYRTTAENFKLECEEFASEQIKKMKNEGLL